MSNLTIRFLSMVILGGLLSWGVTAQNTTQVSPVEYANNIDSFELKRHLFFLASNYMQGRETGTVGNNKAANYIAHYFQKWGLEAIDSSQNYHQPVAFTKMTGVETYLAVEGVPLEAFADYAVSPFRQQPIDTFSAPSIYFAGYGIQTANYNDFGTQDWTDKVVIIFKSLPTRLSKELPEEATKLSLRLQNCLQKGVKAVLVIDEGLRKYSARTRRYLDAQFLQLGQVDPKELPLPPHAHVSTALAEEWFSQSKRSFKKYRKRLLKNGGISEGAALEIPLAISGSWSPDTEYVYSQNVVGYLPGKDPNLKNDHIIISAHYDHLGKRENAIYNGADDNGSGTTGVLTLAETFSKWVQDGNSLNRSILFVLMTGEEKGLLGSKYYAEHPLLPLDKAIANINVDMIGRIDETYRQKDDYIYVIGADRISQDLHDINEAANEKGPQLILDYTYNEEDDPNRYYYRSDHYNFAKKGIPAIFYFNGTHEDYHGVGDTAEEINFTAMQKRIQLIFLTAMQLAQQQEPLEMNSSR